ncbi:MAG: hypothetical protein UX62_C0026G0006 [Microgenomates group bacterium GW2011_GWA2_46_7]|nr:MAG: hypothetical protein UX62_C0026G0006 [Microgenomates group bacterium GW2011_GWA2_46_7]
MHRLDVHQPLTTSLLHFGQGSRISQTFYSHRDNLDIVSICLRNPDRYQIPLQFVLSEGKQVVRSLDFNSANIDFQDCTKFQFPKVEDSANKTYQVEIISPKSTDPLSISPLILDVEAHTGTDYLGGVASLNDKDTGLDLHFKTFYHQSIQDTLVESLTQIPPRIPFICHYPDCHHVACL